MIYICHTNVAKNLEEASMSALNVVKTFTSTKMTKNCRHVAGVIIVNSGEVNLSSFRWSGYFISQLNFFFKFTLPKLSISNPAGIRAYQ